MSAVDALFDTSVLMYLLSSDAAKSDRVEALLADCKVLYSEDLQHGQLIDRQLRVVNPFSGR